MKKNAMRRGGSESRSPAVTGSPAEIDSSHGRDITAPAPRRNVLRETGIGIVLPRFLLIRLSRLAGSANTYSTPPGAATLSGEEIQLMADG
jgi:hypothetical protein